MKKSIAFVFGALVFSAVSGQLTVTPDTTICTGRYVQISASGGGASYSWSPITGLNNPNSATTIADPATTTTYVVTSQTQLPNQFVNGDFSQGNTGFTSGYTYITPPNNSGNAYYWVGATPSLFSGGMSNCSGDHTAGVDTNQLIADGAITANTPVWCQTVSVLPNVNYSLSGYIHALNNTNMPGGRWSVNGTLLTGNNPFILFPCVWYNFTATWNSGSSTSATFCVLSDHLQANGNDFAIDDLSLTANATLTDTVVITVVSAPVVNLGSDTLACTNQAIMLDAANAGATYIWSDGTMLQTMTTTQAGSISVTVTDANQCTASDTVSVARYDLSVTANSSSTTCGQNNGTATVSASNGYSPYGYLWSNSETTSGISSLTAGIYEVTVTDATGCSATAATTVNSSSTGSVTITTNTTQICASDSAEICAPSGYVSYLWNTGAVTECIAASLAGNYYVTVTDNAACSATSNGVALSVYQQPSVSVSVNGDTLTAFNATSYQWFFNGVEIPNATNAVYVATQSGNYSVQITDANGCYAVSNVIPVATGIARVESFKEIGVFPNPATDGKWHVKVSSFLVGATAEVFNAEGKMVFSTTLKSTQWPVNLNVQSGVYMLKIQDGEQVYWRKLVKQ